MFEDRGFDSKRCLGIERLDRIHSQVVLNEETMVQEDDNMYGLRRGCDNWRFPWLPAGWKVPITWDHLVENVASHADVRTLPDPLRRHVAEHRLRTGQYDLVGTKWERSVPQALAQEIQWEREGVIPFLSGGRRICTTPPPQLVSLLANGVTEFDPSSHAWLADFLPRVCPKTLVRGEDGVWYNPVDTTQRLRLCKLGKRKVSAALEECQSKQLITAFYLLCVEKVEEPLLQRALSLIMFRYMVERGYTARWMGKYDQDAKHVGNGKDRRVFRKLTQYAPHRLPVEVLNKLCGRDGRLQTRGSKGSRSKFKQGKRPHYFPKRRLTRTEDDERSMRSE